MKMNIQKPKWLLACLLATQILSAQTVETVATHPRIVDGIHVDLAGNIFTTPGGLMGGIAIGKATPEGDFDPIFRNGFNGPIDIDENNEGELFVTNYDNNTLKKYDPSTDEVTTVLTGLDGPAGVTLDSEGNVYVTCFGAPPSYSGNQVVKVYPDGTSETWLETADFFRPQGIAFDDDGNLWVANTPSGKIFKIDTTTKVPELVIQFSAKVGNLVFRSKDQHFYFPSQQSHKVYRMNLEGEVEALAGTGSPGVVDGDAATAQFNKPLGIGFTHSEDTLYIAEAGSLRRITGLDEMPSGTDERTDSPGLKVTPNPSTGSVKVEIPAYLKKQGNLMLAISDESGRVAYQQSVQHQEDALTLETLKPGLWYIRLYDGKKMVVEKVVVI